MIIKDGLVEFLGTLAVTFFGGFARLNNQDDFVVIGLTYFFLFSSLVYAFNHISGSHFNPILTISLLMTK